MHHRNFLPPELAKIMKHHDANSEEKIRFVTLSKISEVINSSLEIDKVLNNVMDIVIAVMKAERGFIMMLEPITGDLIFTVARNIARETIEDENFQISRSIIEKVKKEGKTILATDAMTDGRFDGSMSVRIYGLRSVLCVPMLYRGATIGVIFVDNRLQSGVFGEREQETLEAIANMAAIAIENAKLYSDLQKSLLDTVRTLSRALWARDEYTMTHSEMVSVYSRKIARELGVSESEMQEIHMSSMLHDLGKIGVSDSVLLKPGKLNEEERHELEKHVYLGPVILDDSSLPESVKAAIKHHQERFDGKGYPSGLSGEEIPLASRIIAVADAYHAMISDRVYRPALPREVAVAELRKGAGRQFDPQIVEIFLKIIEKENM